jgi:glycosyltransferase involved in cell wall biosynthesis/ribosomal protein S18 acetylase RimI-like enzyme
MHLTTVDMSLALLVLPQLQAVRDLGGTPVGVSAPGPFVADLEREGIRFVPLPSSTRGFNLAADIAAARQFWTIVRQEQPDVVHTHTPKPGIYGRILSRLAGVPIVVNTVHGLYATESDPSWKRTVVYLAEGIAARFSHIELVQSAEDLALLSRLRIAPRSHLRPLGNGVDLSRFDRSRFSDAERRAARSEINAGDDNVVVGTVGRLVGEKGYRELFEAVKILDDDRLVFAWVGPEEPDKTDGLSAVELEDARAAGVRILGQRSDPERWYAAMDLFVLPSHREGFPRGAMEAAAMGLPVVATDIRGCREVVDHEVNGLLVPVGDPAALASAIGELAGDPARRQRMAVAARDKAEAEFDEDAVVRRVINVYRDAALEKGRLDLAKAFGESGPVAYRPATQQDVPFLAALHSEAIATGFLPSLGTGFMRRLYRAMIAWPEATVIVAAMGDDPVGYVAGVANTGQFYHHFLRRFGLGAVLAALPRLVRPRNLRRAVETLRYEAPELDADAELLAMAVTEDTRGQGVGSELGRRFLTAMADRGAGAVRVVVGEENAVAISAYRGMGFRDAAEIEVHRGDRSLILVSER